MTAATLTLWIALAPPPDYYAVPSWPASMEPIVSYWADVYRVPRWLAWRTFMVESGGNPRATGNEWERKGKRWVRGRVLAEGAFMVSVRHRADHLARAGMTAAEFDPWDVSDSARVGLCFLGSLIVYFHGELRPAVAAYNCGRARAEAWWKGERALPAETVDYLRKVLG
jgi:hypothetical protein